MEIFQAAIHYLDDAEAERQRTEYDNAVIFRIWPSKRTPMMMFGHTYLLPRWEVLGLRRDPLTGAHVDRAPLPAGAVYVTAEDLGVPDHLAMNCYYTKRTAEASRFRNVLAAAYLERITSAVNGAMHTHLRRAYTRRLHTLSLWARASVCT